MSAETQTAEELADHTTCWCCGHARAEDALVRLGSHPEVGVCLNCVRSLQRRARDVEATVIRQRLRGAAESVRRDVIAQGWHQLPVIGPALQWVNRHLPW